MPVNFATVAKQPGGKTCLLVHGFVRAHAARRHIPSRIIDICLVFYNEFGMRELFNLNKLLSNVDEYTSKRAAQVRNIIANPQRTVHRKSELHYESICKIILEPIGGQFIVAMLPERIHVVHVASQKVRALHISADSAIVNPSGTLIGLRFNNTLKVYNLSNALKVYNLNDLGEPIQTTDGRDLLFWRWINEREIAFVRRNYVYRWDVDSNEGPVWRVYLGQGNYSIDPSDQYVCTGCGVSPDGYKWYLQCTHVRSGRKLRINYDAAAEHFDRRWSSWLAHAGPYANVTIKDTSNRLGRLRHRKCMMESGVICPIRESHHTTDAYCALMHEQPPDGIPIVRDSVDLYAAEADVFSLSKRYDVHVPVPFMPEDVVAIIHACDGWIYVAVKKGFIFVYAHLGAAKLFSMRISQNDILYAASNSRTGGMVAIDSRGAVIECRVGPELLKAAVQRRHDVMTALKLLAKFSKMMPYEIGLLFPDDEILFLLRYFELVFEKTQIADIDIIQIEHAELYKRMRECSESRNCLLQSVDEQQWKQNGGSCFAQNWPKGIDPAGVDLEQVELRYRVLSAMHCYFVHSIDIGMRIKVCEVEDEQNEMPTEVDMQFVHKMRFKGYVVYVTQSRRRPVGLRQR